MKNTYLSPRISSQYYFCPFPFTVDTYSGCTHNCKYCFSYFGNLLISGGNKDFFSSAKKLDISSFERVISGNPKTKTEKNLSLFVEKRIPLHWGGMSDPFCSFEGEEKTSLEMLKLLAKYDYPFIISTKNARLIEKEYKKAFLNCKHKVLQVSLISDRKEMELVETHPDVQVDKRFNMIKEIADEGVRVVVRLQPFIPLFCEKGLGVFIKRIKDAGAKAITVEVLKVPVMLTPSVKDGLHHLSEAIGYDVVTFYKKFGEPRQSDYELKKPLKEKIILAVKKKAKEVGLEFYCADNEFRYLGDSPVCCGTGDEEGFQSFNPVSNDKIFNTDKKVFSMEDVIPTKSCLDCINLGFLNLGNAFNSSACKGQSMADKAREVWNNEKSPLSPCKFYNNIEVMGKDKDGNLVYKKKRK